jgi:hypothetical protein
VAIALIKNAHLMPSADSAMPIAYKAQQQVAEFRFGFRSAVESAQDALVALVDSYRFVSTPLANPGPSLQGWQLCL